MTESSEPIYYSLHTEAEQFIKEWPDQWELDEQKAQSYTITIGEGKNQRVDNLLSLFSGAISGYKIALTNFSMHSKMSSLNRELAKKSGLPNFPDIATSTAKMVELNNAGATLIDLKNRLEAIKALQRRPSPYKRIQELENELKQEKALREKAEIKANEAETEIVAKKDELSKLEIEHETLDKMYNRIRIRAIQTMGTKWFEDAITSDPFEENEVEDASEDDGKNA